MRIAYLGLDEVNRYYTRKWIRRTDGEIKFVNVQSLGISTKCPAVVVDLDSLPGPHRQRWLGWLTSFACQKPALVFGHTLSDEESASLRRCGIQVVRRALRRRTLENWMERKVLCCA